MKPERPPQLLAMYYSSTAFAHGFDDYRQGRESLIDLLALVESDDYAWDYQLGWHEAEQLEPA